MGFDPMTLGETMDLEQLLGPTTRAITIPRERSVAAAIPPEAWATILEKLGPIVVFFLNKLFSRIEAKQQAKQQPKP